MKSVSLVIIRFIWVLLSGIFLFFLNSRCQIINIDAYAAISFDIATSVVDTLQTNNPTFGQTTKTGDINGDGYDDLLIATGQELVVYFGGETLDTNVDLIIDDGSTGYDFPAYRGGNFAVGDLDNDGYDDFVLGYLYATKAYIFFGSNSLTGTKSPSDADITITESSTFGAGSTFGDVNGDGYLDLIVGAATHSTTGAILVYYGNGTRALDTTADKTLAAPSGTFFATYNIIGGDINNDGYYDFMGCRADFGVSECYLFYGGADMDTIYDVSFTGEASTDKLGCRRGAITDINNDGYDDICLNARDNDTPGTNAGRVYCFFGSSSFSGDKTVGTDADFILSGSAGDFFGNNIDLVDINNDGHQDLVVGTYAEYLNIYLGNGSNNFDTTADVTITGASVGESNTDFGWVVGTGDMDEDGWIDLFITSQFGGYGNGGRVRFSEINHGSPNLTVNPSFTTNDATPDTGGNVTVSGRNIAGAQWSFSNSLPGSWHDCTSTSDSFNSDNESFSCHIQSSDLQEGKHTVYFRSYDENQLYLSSKLYAQREILVDYTSPSSFSLLTQTILLLIPPTYSKIYTITILILLDPPFPGVLTLKIQKRILMKEQTKE